VDAILRQEISLSLYRSASAVNFSGTIYTMHEVILTSSDYFFGRESISVDTIKTVAELIP
jgi:hypothetical protein